MDNAAKALLIAGGILLSIIVLSLFMLMLNSLTDYQQAQTQIERNQDIVTFNNQYAGYLRDGISGYDILSIINKVTFYNRTKPDETISIKINLNGKNNLFVMNGESNKLFTSDVIEVGKNTSTGYEIENGINSLLNTTMPVYPSYSGFSEKYRTRALDGKIKYTDQILQGLLDNYNSNESIFADNFCSAEVSKEERRKRFSSFNVIVGQTFFPLLDYREQPISDSRLKTWWRDYFSETTASKTDSRGITIREELLYYYEYKQFQRGKFNYIVNNSKPTYSSETGRIVNMEFEFTGEFI